MSASSRLRAPNPHLGAYYGIVASAFVSLAIMLAMLEQLGWSETFVAETMVGVPLVLYLIIAVGARTMTIEDFFASGRRVPSVFNGFVLAAIAVGGVGFFAYTGTLFFLGFDALAIGLGLTCGLLIAGVLFVPYLRKAGSYTLPSFLGHRFRSRYVRMAACLLQLPPSALLLVAELKFAALIASLFLPLSFSLAVIVITALVAACVLFGGMRSLTWTGSAQFLTSAVGVAAPLIVVSIMLTNLPAPQFTYGETFSPLHDAEITAGLTPVQPNPATPTLPGAQPTPVTKPFLEPFGSLSQTDFTMLFLCMALGIASLPSLLVRSGVTGSTADQRRSVAWAVLFVALFAMTAPAIAAFAKLVMFQDIAQVPASAPPPWLSELSGRHLLQSGDANGDGAIGASELHIARDSIATALPLAAKLPYLLTALMAASGMAIALAAAGAHLFTLAASLAEDLYRVLDRRPTALPRLIAAWAAVGASALASAMFLLIADFDPLRAALTALAFAASTFFPILLLAIWWRRCTSLGALAAMSVGFIAMVVETVLGAAGGGHAIIATAMTSLIGAGLGLVAGIGASYIGSRPSEAEASYCEAMRNPSGEAIYDRAQQKVAAAAAAGRATSER
jgi:cation/acetate symporter